MSTPVPRFGRDRTVHGLLAVIAAGTAGDAVWEVGVTWTAVHLASPAVAGAVLAAGTVPRAIVLLYGGVLADRVDPLRLMRITNLARAAVLGGVVAAAYAGALTLGVLVAAVVLFGVADALFNPSAATVPRQLVRPEDLPAYFGILQTGIRLGGVVGGAVGGLVVAAWGIEGAAALDGATFLVEAAFLLLVRARFPLPRAVPDRALRSIAAGFGHLRREPLTRTVVLTLSGLNLAVGPATGLGVALRAVHEGWGAHVVGFADALAAAGATLASLALVRFRPRRVGVWGFGLLAVQGLAIVALGAGGRLVLGAACLAIGVTAGAASVLLASLFQSVVAGAYLGRMASIQRLGDAALMPAANALFGAIAAAAAPFAAFAFFGGAMTVVMLRTLGTPFVRRVSLPAPADTPSAVESR